LAIAESASLSLDYTLAQAAVIDPAIANEVASTLLAYDTSRADQVLGQLIEIWSARDPDGAVEWLIEHSSEVDSSLTGALAQRLAALDVETAMGYVDQLPPDIRNTWIVQISGPYAARDPAGALAWITQFQGEGFYEGARAQIIMQTATSQPELAATLISTLPPALQASTSQRVARAWSVQDPQGAATWAATLQGSEAGSNAARSIVTEWIKSNSHAAHEWAVGLPRGDMRDSALAALISGSINTGLDPVQILEEIDSEVIRQNASMRAISDIAVTRPDIAVELLESMLDDPEIGEWASESLERLRAMPR
jgi:hypothetical protein